MKYSPELNLLLLSLNLSDPHSAVKEAEALISSGILNWEQLLKKASVHCIRPSLENFLKEITPGQVPGFVSENLHNENRENTLRQLRNTSEFLRIRAMLENEGIPAIPFKGFWFGHAYYGNISGRESGDVDLYIRLNDLDRIIVLMLGEGYLIENMGTNKYISKSKKESAELNFQYFRAGVCVHHFEFHWKIGSTLHKLDISFDELEDHIVKGNLQGHELPVFDPSASLVLAVMHHAGKDPLIQLKHIDDIARIIKDSGSINWDWVVKTAERHGISTILYLSVFMASVITGIDLPEPFKKQAKDEKYIKLSENRMRAMDLQPERWRGFRFEFNSLLFHLRTRKSFTFRIRMFFSIIKSLFGRMIVPEPLIKKYLKLRYGIVKE